MILTYGKKAVVAQCARGIGPKSATRVLVKDHTGDTFLKDLLEQEKIYARTRRFWR